MIKQRVCAGLAAAMILAGAPHAWAASQSYWALSAVDLRRALPDSVAVVGGDPRLRIWRVTDVALAGARWQDVDFIFDADGWLERVIMSSEDQSYETLKAQVLAGLNTERPALHAAVFDSMPQGEAVRICQDETGKVTLTYARPKKTDRSVMIAAQAERSGAWARHSEMGQ